MTYEQKMAFLNSLQPEKKDQLLLDLVRGKKIDLTKDEDLYFKINADRVSMDVFTNRDKYKHAAKATKAAKEGMFNPRNGASKNNKIRWLGDIPAEIYFSRPEFNPLLPKEERDRNIRKFLNQFPTFRAPDKAV